MVKVQQAARCGHQNIRTPPQFVDLRTDFDAAEDDVAAQGEIAAVGGHTVGHLCRQLPCWCEDQGAHITGTRRLTTGETVQQGQGKAGGLAGAGLGGGHDIAALQHNRDGLLLNGRRGVVALRTNGVKDRGG